MARRLIALAVVGVVALGAAVAFVPALKYRWIGVTFRFKPSAGQAWRATQKTEGGLKFDISSLPLPVRMALPNDVRQFIEEPMTLVHSIEYGVSVVAADETGCTLEFVDTRSEWKAIVAGRERAIPAGQRLDGVRWLMAPDGTVLNEQLPGGLQMDPQQHKQAIQLVGLVTGSDVEFPSHRVRLGGTWDRPVELTLNTPSGQLQARGHRMFTLDSIEGDTAFMHYGTEAVLEASPGQSQGVTLKATINGAGNCRVRLSDGVTTGIDGICSIDLRLEFTGPLGMGGSGQGKFEVKTERSL